VPTETPANRATSLIVAGRPGDPAFSFVFLGGMGEGYPVLPVLLSRPTN
jgi:hypothetical protein